MIEYIKQMNGWEIGLAILCLTEVLKIVHTVIKFMYLE